MGILDDYQSVVSTPQRREVLMAMTGGQLLVQLSSMPVTLALPSIARHFETGNVIGLIEEGYSNDPGLV